MSGNHRIRGWFLTGLLLAAFAGIAAGSQPRLRPFSAEYDLKLGYLSIGKVRVTLHLDRRGRYRYRALTEPVGLTAVLRSDEITEISHGEIRDGTVVPLSYRYRHLKSDNPRRVDLHFDWQAMQVTNRTPESEWVMRIKPGTQDKFSQQLMLILALMKGDRSIDFPVADGGRLKRYLFLVQERVTVETPAGRFASLHLMRRKQGQRATADFWMAPELNYLPVKVERREKEGDFVMELLSLRWDDE